MQKPESRQTLLPVQRRDGAVHFRAIHKVQLRLGIIDKSVLEIIQEISPQWFLTNSPLRIIPLNNRDFQPIILNKTPKRNSLVHLACHLCQKLLQSHCNIRLVLVRIVGIP